MAIPQPPNFTGVLQEDVRRCIDYLHKLYEVAFVQGEVLTEGEQSESGDFDPTDLPDPASTTLAQTQQTANEAYALAVAAQQDADTNAASITALTVLIAALTVRLGRFLIGTFTVADAASSAVITFATAMPDTSYVVLVVRSGKAGSPAANSDQVDTITRTTADATIQFKAAPGVGAGVDFFYLVARPQA